MAGVVADLESCEDDMFLAGEADDDGALLDGFLGVFNLEYSSLGGAGGGVSDIRFSTGEEAYKVTESLS